MPWYGAVVWSERGQQRKYCCQWDPKRRFGLELPKGGMEKNRRKTSGAPDSSPFATARWELWEEVGLWLQWRWSEDFHWVSQRGHALPLGPGPQQSAFLVTKLQDKDGEADCRRREWLTLEECERKGLRKDHLQLLKRLGNQASAAAGLRRGTKRKRGGSEATSVCGHAPRRS